MTRRTRAKHYLYLVKDGQYYRTTEGIPMFEDAWDKANEIAEATGLEVEIWFRGECIHTSTPLEEDRTDEHTDQRECSTRG